MRFLVTPLIEYERSLQPQEDGLPMWLSSDERPAFNWADVYPDNGQVINYYKDPESGEDNFDSCAEQLRLLLNYIIEIDKDKFKIISDLKENIKLNLIFPKIEERKDPKAPKVSDLNIRAVLCQIKPTLEKHLLLLKHKHHIISKKDIDQFYVTACFSGADSNLKNMMLLFYPNKIVSHAYKAYKEYIRQKAIEFCREGGLIDYYNYGNEVHYVNGLLNVILDVSNLSLEIDELIPTSEIANYKVQFLNWINGCFKPSEIIEIIMMSWPLLNKARWSYNDVQNFFTYYENIEKDVMDPDVNYWEIMFELDDKTYEFIPKKEIELLYRVYVLHILNKEKILELPYKTIWSQNTKINILDIFIKGYIFYINEAIIKPEGVLTSTTFSLLKEHKYSKEIILSNINFFNLDSTIQFLFNNISNKSYLALSQKLIEINHPELYQYNGLKCIYDHLEINELQLILEQSDIFLRNFLLSAICINDTKVIEIIYKISEQSSVINAKILEIINYNIEQNHIPNILIIANTGKWKVRNDYLYHLCINGIYNNFNNVIYILNLPVLNRLSKEQVNNLFFICIHEEKWWLLSYIFTITNIFKKPSSELFDILNQLIKSYIIKRNNRAEIIFPILNLAGLNFNNKNWSDSIAKNIAKLFFYGPIEDALQIYNVSRNHVKEDQILYFFIYQNLFDRNYIKETLPESDTRTVKYHFELSRKNFDVTKKMLIEYFNKKTNKIDDKDSENWNLSINCGEDFNQFAFNYYLTVKLILGLTTPDNMSFLLDFKLKTARNYLDKFMNFHSNDIDSELQAIIDKAKSWKRRKSKINY